MAPASLSAILDELARLAGERLEVAGPLGAESRLVEDLGLDSLGLLTLAVEVEDHFRIEIEEAEEAGLRTLGDLASLVATKRGAATER